MHIIHIGAEVAPAAKVGGLGDVIYGLSRETQKLGHQIELILPKYDILLTEEIKDFECTLKTFPVVYDGKEYKNTIWKGNIGGLKVYFIDAHHPDHFYSKGCIYGCRNDIDRFLYFSKAAWELIRVLDLSPDIVHLHDWQTAAIALLAKEKPIPNAKIVFTSHNMEYQGRCAPHEIERIGLKKSKYYVPGNMQDSVYPEALNLMRGALLYSDHVTTVSPTYAEEVKTSRFGMGLDSLLKEIGGKFQGILNGIDFDYWNPETDRHLTAHYGPRELPKTGKNHHILDRKGYVKKSLRNRLQLDESHRPIVGSITRLVPQKGVEIIKHAIESVVKMGGQFVLLGSSPIPALDEEFHQLKRKFADHPHVSITLLHQEELAHMIFAASDMFIVPSNFEPCGLTQMIALHYGSIPIVRCTGGLKDTIVDVDTSGKPLEQTNGFTFKEQTPQAFDAALKRAIGYWRDQPDTWRKLVINGMTWDFSWKNPTKEYIRLYENLKSQKARTKKVAV